MLDYSEFGISNLFFLKLSKKNLWGLVRPPFVKEGLNMNLIWQVCLLEVDRSGGQGHCLLFLVNGFLQCGLLSFRAR